MIQVRGAVAAAGAALGLAAALLTGCGSSDMGSSGTTLAAPAASHPVAVAEPALQPSGSALGPGLAVQEGSTLVGAVFPTFEQSATPATDVPATGWEAVLVVDGDPIDVWNRYVHELGLEEVASARKACVVSRPPAPGDSDVAPADSRFLTEPAIDGEDRLVCRVVDEDTTADMIVGASCTPSADDPPACDRVATAHLYLKVLDVPEEVAPELRLGTDALRYERALAAAPEGVQAVEPAEIPDGDLVLPALDLDLPSELPAAGQPLDHGMDPYLSWTDYQAEIAILPEGAESLVAPALLLDCNSGLVAVLSVPGTPEEAVGIFDAASEKDDPIGPSSGTDAEGQAWAGGTIATAGGYYVSLTAVDDGEGAATVLYTECGD
jgi:hypothetical protein